MKKYGITLGIFMMFMLSGCAGMDNYIEQEVRAQSGILEDENYISYQNKVASGNVGEDGFYMQGSEEAEKAGSIHVTFATNSKLDVQYFEDDGKSTVLDTTSCYLNPGDHIYAQVETGDDVALYEFSGFNIYEYNAAGEKSEAETLKQDYTKTGMVVQIPPEYDKTEICIVPVGKYHSREISLWDYYTDDSGTEHDLSGTWLVNDDVHTGDVVEMNPLSSYVISYQYDNSEYFYVSSEPECYYNDTDDGTIIFQQRTANDETADYSVELHPYIQVSLISGTNRIVRVNSEDTQAVKENTELTISGLKYGDRVQIATNVEWRELENNESLIWIGTESLSSGPHK